MLTLEMSAIRQFSQHVAYLNLRILTFSILECGQYHRL